MADLYCERCGEPWDSYYVRHEMEPMEKERFLRGENCPACANKEVSRRPVRAEIASALHDVLVGDLDGLAAEMEDAEYTMGREFWQ